MAKYRVKREMAIFRKVIVGDVIELTESEANRYNQFVEPIGRPKKEVSEEVIEEESSMSKKPNKKYKGGSKK